MKKMSENVLTDEIYVPEKGKGFKRWFIVVALFFVAFLWTFPFEKTIENLVRTAILSQRACPINYEKMNLTWFAPGFEFEKPVIAGACFQKPDTELPLEKLTVSFAGPNFSPLGIRFKVAASTEQSTFEAYPALGISQKVVRISDTSIGEDILKILTGIDLIEGSIQLDGLVELAGNQVSSAKFKVESKSLRTKTANIQGFLLPPLKLGPLALFAELDAAGKLFIEKLSLGEAKSTLAANFKGDITLNRYNMLFSNANLVGEVRFSDEFYEAIPLVKLLLQGKQATDGFYKLEIKGPLGQTRPNFL